MIEIGKWNDLTVKSEKEFGVYLGCDGDTREILLPRKQVPKGTRIGDVISAFIYRDSADRLIATVNVPYITMDKLRVLKCVGVTSVGAFMDWGLEKDILLPFKEQTAKVREGREYLVRMYADKSDRLCVSMKVYDYLKCDSPYKQGDEVSGIVIEYKADMGAFVAVDDRYSALIPKKEIHSPVYVGDRVHGRVSSVRDDGKLNLTLQKPIKMQIEENSELVLDVIESYSGKLPFNDKADASRIEREFGISKRAFKAAVGKLLKDGRIRITEEEILMLTDDERAELKKNGDVSSVVIRKHRDYSPRKDAVSYDNSDYSRRKGESAFVGGEHRRQSRTVKFNIANGGRRNNRRAMLAELEEYHRETSDDGNEQ